MLELASELMQQYDSEEDANSSDTDGTGREHGRPHPSRDEGTEPKVDRTPSTTNGRRRMHDGDVLMGILNRGGMHILQGSRDGRRRDDHTGMNQEDEGDHGSDEEDDDDDDGITTQSRNSKEEMDVLTSVGPGGDADSVLRTMDHDNTLNEGSNDVGDEDAVEEAREQMASCLAEQLNCSGKRSCENSSQRVSKRQNDRSSECEMVPIGEDGKMGQDVKNNPAEEEEDCGPRQSQASERQETSGIRNRKQKRRSNNRENGSGSETKAERENGKTGASSSSKGDDSRDANKDDINSSDCDSTGLSDDGLFDSLKADRQEAAVRRHQIPKKREPNYFREKILQLPLPPSLIQHLLFHREI